MDLKTAQTCTGCDRIMKNMKKIAGSTSRDSIADMGDDTLVEVDVGSFINETSKNAGKTSAAIVKKMNKSAKSKSPMGTVKGMGKY